MPLRMPSRVAAAQAAAPAPPPPITAMNANWEPPVNISALRATVSHTDSPAATDSAPKETPYTPTAIAIEIPMRTAGVRRSEISAGTASR